MILLNEPGKMLQALNPSETRNGMEQLDTSRTVGWSTVKEKQKATTSRVLDGFINKLHHRLALESGNTSEAKVACINWKVKCLVNKRECV